MAHALSHSPRTDSFTPSCAQSTTTTTTTTTMQLPPCGGFDGERRTPLAGPGGAAGPGTGQGRGPGPRAEAGPGPGLCSRGASPGSTGRPGAGGGVAGCHVSGGGAVAACGDVGRGGGAGGGGPWRSPGGQEGRAGRGGVRQGMPVGGPSRCCCWRVLQGAEGWWNVFGVRPLAHHCCWLSVYLQCTEDGCMPLCAMQKIIEVIQTDSLPRVLGTPACCPVTAAGVRASGVGQAGPRWALLGARPPGDWGDAAGGAAGAAAETPPGGARGRRAGGGGAAR